MNLFKRIKSSRILQRKTENRNRAATACLRELGFSLPAIRGALIKLNNVNVADLARESEITAPTIYTTAYGKRKNRQGREILAEALGMDTRDLFPEEQQDAPTRPRSNTATV